MLSAHRSVAVLAVTDLPRARSFYEGTLGFSGTEGPGGVTYGAAGTEFLVYPSSFAGTNKATGISFQVAPDAFDAEVEALRGAGIEFQTFDVPEGEWRDGVLVGMGMKAAWFADPDGNILNIESEA